MTGLPDPLADAENSPIVRFRPAGSEGDLRLLRADRRSDGAPGFVQQLPRLPPHGVRRGRVSVLPGQDRSHEFRRFRADRGRRGVIQINRKDPSLTVRARALASERFFRYDSKVHHIISARRIQGRRGCVCALCWRLWDAR